MEEEYENANIRKESNYDNILNEPKNLEFQKKVGDYILFDQIGKGTFSKVTRALHLITNQMVAVKILDKSKIEDDVDIERIIREIEILKYISHPNIVQIYEVYSTIHNFYLMMELMEGCDLFDYITANEGLSEQKACHFFRQLISVLDYLVSIGICHRDIKPENILLDKKQQNLKIIDFGLSNYCGEKEFLASSCGSPCYASPEMLSGFPYKGVTTDTWSSGIVLYFMLVGSLPFDSQELAILYDQIRVGKFYIPSSLSMEAIDLLKKILEVDPMKRITLDEIKKHPWFVMENNPMYKGINIIEENFPCDKKIVKYILKKYFKDDKEVTVDDCVEMIENLFCNKFTATYLICKKYNLMENDKEFDINNSSSKNTDNIINANNSSDCEYNVSDKKNEDNIDDILKKYNDEQPKNTLEVLNEKKSKEKMKDNYNKNNKKSNHINKYYKTENISKINTTNNSQKKTQSAEKQKIKNKAINSCEITTKKQKEEKKSRNDVKINSNKRHLKIETEDLNKDYFSSNYERDSNNPFSPLTNVIFERPRRTRHITDLIPKNPNHSKKSTLKLNNINFILKKTPNDSFLNDKHESFTSKLRPCNILETIITSNINKGKAPIKTLKKNRTNYINVKNNIKLKNNESVLSKKMSKKKYETIAVDKEKERKNSIKKTNLIDKNSYNPKIESFTKKTISTLDIININYHRLNKNKILAKKNKKNIRYNRDKSEEVTKDHKFNNKYQKMTSINTSTSMNEVKKIKSVTKAIKKTNNKKIHNEKFKFLNLNNIINLSMTKKSKSKNHSNTHEMYSRKSNSRGDSSSKDKRVTYNKQQQMKEFMPKVLTSVFQVKPNNINRQYSKTSINSYQKLKKLNSTRKFQSELENKNISNISLTNNNNKKDIFNKLNQSNSISIKQNKLQKHDTNPCILNIKKNNLNLYYLKKKLQDQTSNTIINTRNENYKLKKIEAYSFKKKYDNSKKVSPIKFENYTDINESYNHVNSGTSVLNKDKKFCMNNKNKNLFSFIDYKNDENCKPKEKSKKKKSNTVMNTSSNREKFAKGYLYGKNSKINKRIILNNDLKNLINIPINSGKNSVIYICLPEGGMMEKIKKNKDDSSATEKKEEVNKNEKKDTKAKNVIKTNIDLY